MNPATQLKQNKQFKLLPAKGKVIVRRSAVEETTKGGLYIPDPAKPQTQTGTVIASHPENMYQVNDYLLFGLYAGTEVKLNDEVLLILSEREEDSHIFSKLVSEGE